MQQAIDFLDESETLSTLLETISDHDWQTQTAFKNWTVNDVLVHLHFWNMAADLSLNDSDAFAALFGELASAMQQGGLRPFENAKIRERGTELLHVWQDRYRDMAERWSDLDPKTRVKWAGPDMSVRSSMTARQMETWSHGQEVFDLFGKVREEKDRIRNVVILGINTFQWSFKVHGMEPPGEMSYLTLAAPSGVIWNFGESNHGNTITGSAVEFCQVVTQTRNVADTGLVMTGACAQAWMENAQCFAGPPEQPPAPGTRAPK